ncbi:MAG: hypothetical protein AAF092_03590 [Pseudomonadota bacterium]
MQPQDWRAHVHSLMAQGLGYDDIARRLGCSAVLVRREAMRVREQGLVETYYGVKVGVVVGGRVAR